MVRFFVLLNFLIVRALFASPQPFPTLSSPWPELSKEKNALKNRINDTELNESAKYQPIQKIIEEFIDTQLKVTNGLWGPTKLEKKFSMAEISYYQGRLGEAFSHFQKVKYFDDENIMAWIYQLRILDLQKKKSERSMLLKDFLDKFPELSSLSTFKKEKILGRY